jgi:hypothetical protein
MDKFYKEISKLSSDNIETKIALERQKEHDNIENMKIAIGNIYSLITDSLTINENITQVASKGYNKCTIFEFNPFDKEEDTKLPLIFIFKGPKFNSGYGNGLNFFKHMEVEALLYKLNKHFNPFKLYFHFNTKNKKYYLDIIW